MKPKAAAHEVFVTPRGGTSVEGAVAIGSHVVVLVSHATDAGVDSCIFLTLDANGRRVGDPVTLEDRSAYLATMSSAGGHALVFLTEREEERRGKDGTTVLIHDHPHLFDLGKPPRLRPKSVAAWNDVDVARIASASQGRTTAWVMCRVAWVDNVANGTLVWGFADGASDPEMRSGDVPSGIIAPVLDGARIVALLGGAKELGLYELPVEGAPRRLADVARARSKTRITDAALLPLRDGWALVWYAEPSDRSASGAGLWARPCSSSLDDLGEPVHVAREDDARWNEWRAYDVGDGALVLFGSGDLGDPVKQIRWRTRADLAKDAKRFPGKLPAAVVVTPEGALALTETFSNGGRKTTITARVIDT